MVRKAVIAGFMLLFAVVASFAGLTSSASAVEPQIKYKSSEAIKYKAPEAIKYSKGTISTNSVANTKLYHKSTSQKPYIGVWSGYNASGEIGTVYRGKYASESGVDFRVKSVYVPKKCELYVKGALWWSGGRTGSVFNIGKYRWIGRVDMKLKGCSR
jgi:hypothetical protein